MEVDVYKVTIEMEVIAQSKSDAAAQVGALFGGIMEKVSGINVGDPEKVDLPEQKK